MEKNNKELKELNIKEISEINKPEEFEKSNEKFEEIRAEVEPILKTLDNDYSIEKGEDGTQTIVVYGKNNEIVASINEKETNFFNIEFEQKFFDVELKLKDIRNKVKAVKNEKTKENKDDGNKENENDEKNKEENIDENEEEKEDNKDEKELKNKNATSKEDIKKELGDDYIVAAEINDEEISKKFNATEGFIGNPFIGYNKKTNQFVIIGNNGNGKLKEAKLLTVSAQGFNNVDKYNYDGSEVQERGLTAQNIMLLPPENNDGIDLRMNEYGQIEMNKIVNLRGDNPQSFPIDTKQRVPSSQEISEMKANGEKMEEITKIIDELEAKDVIDKDEKNELMEKIATNGKSMEEDKKMLEDMEKDKEEHKEKEEKEIEDEAEENAETAKENDEEELDESWFIYGMPRSH